MPGTSALRDNFDSATIGSAWTASTSGSATATQTTSQARFTLPSSTAGTHAARFTSKAQYNLSGDSFYITIGTMVATGVAATAFFQMYLDGLNRLQWVQLSGTVYARSVVNNTTVDEFSASWSAATYKYLRIRADSTTVYWDSSSTGTAWTNRASKAITALFPVTDLYIDFGASCGNIASPGSFRLDDVNLILPALTTSWNWTQVRWPVEVVHRNVTMAIDTAGTGQAYVVTADGVDVSNAPTGNIRYFSGPASDGRTLTEQASEAAAQAAAVNIPTDGRFDLPEMVQCRCVRVGHRSIDGSAYTIRELYPRRLVQADDIEAESIRALHIAAEQINATHINAVLDITGKLIRTAYSGARVVLSGDAFGGFIGYGDADTYDPLTGTGTYQVLWKLTDGKLYAGGGVVVLDEDGIALVATTTDDNLRSYQFTKSDGTRIGKLVSNTTAGAHEVNLYALPLTSELSNVSIISSTPTSVSTGDSGILLSVARGVNSGTLHLYSHDNTDVILDIAAATTITDDLSVDGGVNVGTATGATAGQVKASHSIWSTGASAGLRFDDRTGAQNWQWYGTSSVVRLHTGTTDALQIGGSGTLNIVNGGALQIASTQVVGARKTGWAVPTGTLARTTFVSDTVTLVELAKRVAALITDLHGTGGHGLVGT